MKDVGRRVESKFYLSEGEKTKGCEEVYQEEKVLRVECAVLGVRGGFCHHVLDQLSRMDFELEVWICAPDSMISGT